MIIPIRCTSCGKVPAHLWKNIMRKFKNHIMKVLLIIQRRMILKMPNNQTEKRILDEMI